MRPYQWRIHTDKTRPQKVVTQGQLFTTFYFIGKSLFHVVVLIKHKNDNDHPDAEWKKSFTFIFLN